MMVSEDRFRKTPRQHFHNSRAADRYETSGVISNFKWKIEVENRKSENEF